MKLNFLWRLAIPLLLATLAGQAHADLIATVNVNAAQHWTDVDGWVTDELPFTPIAGTLSSNLSLVPNGKCNASKNPASHFSHCLFSADLSQLHSSTADSYLPRFGDPTYVGTQFQSFINIDDNGKYYANFIFINYVANVTEDDVNMYEMSLDTDYEFYFEGEGMATSTKMDADLATWIWTNTPLVRSSFTMQWAWTVTDLLTGVGVTGNAEGWYGDMDVTRGISNGAAIPEPATPALLLAGLLGIGYLNRKKALARRA